MVRSITHLVAYLLLLTLPLQAFGSVRVTASLSGQTQAEDWPAHRSNGRGQFQAFAEHPRAGHCLHAMNDNPMRPDGLSIGSHTAKRQITPQHQDHHAQSQYQSSCPQCSDCCSPPALGASQFQIPTRAVSNSAHRFGGDPIRTRVERVPEKPPKG